MEESVNPKENNKFYKRKLVWLLVLLVIVIVGGGFGFKTYLDNRSPIPKELARQLTFPLYYPKKLPVGYEVVHQSMKVADGVLIFNIKAADGKLLPVAEQELPKNLDFDTQDKVTPIKFDTPIGKAQVRSIGANRVAYIVTQKTWVLITVNGIANSDAMAVAAAFR